MNFKRKTTKRRVRCTLCTKHRWRGNSKRHAPVIAEHREAQKVRQDMQGEANG